MIAIKNGLNIEVWKLTDIDNVNLEVDQVKFLFIKVLMAQLDEAHPFLFYKL